MVEDINAYNKLKSEVTQLFTEVIWADRRAARSESVVIGEPMIHQFPWSKKDQMLLTHPGYTLDEETKLFVPYTPPSFTQEMIISLVVNGGLVTGRRLHFAGRVDSFVRDTSYRDCVAEQAASTGFGGVQRLGVIIDGNGQVYVDSPFFSNAPRVNNMPSYMAMLRESQATLGFLHSHLMHQTKSDEDSTHTK
jgi:hypothetical protein